MKDQMLTATNAPAVAAPISSSQAGQAAGGSFGKVGMLPEATACSMRGLCGPAVCWLAGAWLAASVAVGLAAVCGLPADTVSVAGKSAPLSTLGVGGTTSTMLWQSGQRRISPIKSSRPTLSGALHVRQRIAYGSNTRLFLWARSESCFLN